ncbi:MAG: hypothetical protein ACK5HS_02740 [Mycoplasmatales bacterium]
MSNNKEISEKTIEELFEDNQLLLDNIDLINSGDFELTEEQKEKLDKAVEELNKK